MKVNESQINKILQTSTEHLFEIQSILEATKEFQSVWEVHDILYYIVSTELECRKTGHTQHNSYL